jgi:hypothetical protein
MIVYSETVFDEVLMSTAVSYTSIKHCEALSKGDQLAFIAHGENANAGLSLTVAIEHSADGIHWAQKNTSPEINGAVLNNAIGIYGAEPLAFSPSQAFVRLRIQVGGSGLAKARVVVNAFVRDRSKSKPPCCCGCGGGKKKASPRKRAADVLSNAPTLATAEMKKLSEAAGRVLSHEEVFPQLSPEARAELIEHSKRLAALDAQAQGELARLMRGAE